MDDNFAPPPPDSPGTPPPPPPPPGEVLPGAPPSAPGVPYGAPAMVGQPQQSKGSGKKILLIIVIIVLLLCCCTTAAGGYLFYRAADSGDLGNISRSLSDQSAPGGMQVEDLGFTGEVGVPAVWLSWEESVDIDLEIWDANGQEYLTSAYGLIGDDIQYGSDGDEYFEFRSYSGGDFSSGDYVISVYYADMADAQGGDSAYVTVTAKDAQGRVQTFSKTVLWDPGYDQWHAFRIDASTGDVTPMDEFY